MSKSVWKINTSTGVITTVYDFNCSTIIKSIVVDSDDNIYIGTENKYISTIYKFDSNFTELWKWEQRTSTVKVQDLKIKGDYLYVAATNIGGMKLDKNTGSWITRYNPLSPNSFYSANGIAIDSDDNVYLISSGYNLAEIGLVNITKFDNTGLLLTYHYTTQNSLMCVDIDSSDNIYVGAIRRAHDGIMSSVLKYDSDLILDWQYDTGNHVYDIKVSGSSLYVAGDGGVDEDGDDGVIREFTLSGTKTLFITMSTSTLNAIDLDASGNIYTGGIHRIPYPAINEVVKHNSSGTSQWEASLDGIPSTQQIRIYGVALRSDGAYLYCAGQPHAYRSVFHCYNGFYEAKYNSSEELVVYDEEDELKTENRVKFLGRGIFLLGFFKVDEPVEVKYGESLDNLRVANKGDLDVRVYSGFFYVEETKKTYAGSTTNTLTDNKTNYLYMKEEDATLVINTTGYPDQEETPHVPLATAVCSGGDITSLTDDRNEIYRLLRTERPVTLNSYLKAFTVYGMTGDGTHIYLAVTQTGGLSSEPVVVKLDYDLAYVDEFISGLTPDYYRAVAESGSYIYVGGKGGQVKKLDKATLTEQWSYYVGGIIYGIHTDGTYVYVCSFTGTDEDGDAGCIRRISISSGTKSWEANPASVCYAAAYYGGYLYIGLYYSGSSVGLHKINASTGAAVDTYDIGGTVYSLFVQGSKIYCGGRHNTDEDGDTEIIRAFNSSLVKQWGLPEPEVGMNLVRAIHGIGGTHIYFVGDNNVRGNFTKCTTDGEVVYNGDIYDNTILYGIHVNNDGTFFAAGNTTRYD